MAPSCTRKSLAESQSESGPARLALAAAGGQLIQGVGYGRETERQVGVPLVAARGHLVAVAILVILQTGMVGGDAGVHLIVAHGQLDGLVVAAECPAHQVAVKAYPISVQLGVSWSNLIEPADASGPHSKACGPLMTIRWSKFR